MKTHLFTTPDDYISLVNEDGKPEVLIYSAEEGARLLKKFKRNRKVDLLPESETTLTMKIGQSEDVELLREFIYPTEYKPAEYPKNPPPGEIFPITPATPTKFETRKLGLTHHWNVYSAKPDGIDLRLKMNRDMFVGFINYGTPITTDATTFFGKKVEVVITENRIEIPVFDTKQALTRLKVQPGDFIMVRGLNPSARPDSKLPFTPTPKPDSLGGSSHLIALIQVIPLAANGAHLYPPR